MRRHAADRAGEGTRRGPPVSRDRPMERAEAETRSDRRTRPARSVWGPIAASAGLLVIALLGGSLWWAARPSRADEVRAAVAKGRDYLRRGRPDLAFQAVNQIRDDSPEAGEAME